MKKLYLIAAILIALNLAIYAQAKSVGTAQPSTLSLNNVEMLSEEECVSGGHGATSCGISAGIDGADINCDVDCREGFYACCGLHGCHCTPDE